MCVRKSVNWCKENYQTLLAIGALLMIFVFLIDIFKGVGITINLPLYLASFNNLDANTKIYSLSILNFIFTVTMFLIVTNKIKKK